MSTFPSTSLTSISGTTDLQGAEKVFANSDLKQQTTDGNNYAVGGDLIGNADS